MTSARALALSSALFAAFGLAGTAAAQDTGCVKVADLAGNSMVARGAAEAMDLKRAHLPAAAAGGADAEAIGETEKNVPERLRHKDRAVSAEDAANLAAADKTYRLDPEAGEIAFGDGEHGRLPEAGAGRIPAHTPEWTDHNESDPGVTVLETTANGLSEIEKNSKPLLIVAEDVEGEAADTASGLPTGKRRHKPVSVAKPADTAADDGCD